MARRKTFERDAVLDAAMDAFWARGFEATSVQNLVEATGLNRGSLYETFGDKRRLFLESFERYREKVVDETLAALDAPGPARRIIGEFLDGYIERSVADPARRGCFVTNTAVELSAHDADCAARVRASLERMEQALEGVIRRGQAEGGIGGGKDAGKLAAFIVTNMQGLRVLARARPEAERLRDHVALLLSVLD